VDDLTKISALILTWLVAIPAAAGDVPKTPGLSWKKAEHSIALLKDGKAVWQHNHDPDEGKPYIHPLATSDGEVLTWLRPKDHPWHRGLWFSWKFINGLNYWEEDRKTGLSEGRTKIKKAKIKTGEDYSARIELAVSYHPPGKDEVISEKRVLNITAPDDKGTCKIDWTSIFKATGGDATLGRTPIPGEKHGKSYGGYAGLSIRMAGETRGWKYTDSEGRQGKDIHGKKAMWMKAAGNTPSGKEAGVTIEDQKSNLRHPTPWYLAAEMPYFGPALLFNKPYTLKKGESLTLKYRVTVR